MVKDITEKLKKELSKKLEEARVIYIISAIRKILECSKKEGINYPLLFFYCNWMLHTTMDRTPAQIIIHKLESNLKNGINHEEILNLISLEQFKKELDNFLKKFNLPKDIINKEWNNFQKITLDILKSAPLISLNTDGIIKKFTITPSFFGFGNSINWEIELINGRTIIGCFLLNEKIANITEEWKISCIIFVFILLFSLLIIRLSSIFIW